VRHPIAVAKSKEVFAKKFPLSPWRWFQSFEERLREWVEVENNVLAAIESGSRVHTVRYEDWHKNPVKETRGIYAFLDANPGLVNPAEISKRVKKSGNLKYDLDYPDSWKRLKDLRERYGYE
jgi:hypothetical protein